MIPIALQLYTVRADLAQDPVRIIKAVAEIGYQGVEGGTPAGMSNQDYLSLLADNNLILIGSGTSTADLQDNLSRVVERCSELGINTLMCGIGGELRQSDGDWKRVVAGLAEGCAKASEAGLRILCRSSTPPAYQGSGTGPGRRGVPICGGRARYFGLGRHLCRCVSSGC